MFEYLQKLSLEAVMADRERKRKREAQSKAYWLGHSMTRFQDNVARCKACDLTMTVGEDGVRGEAVETHCTQQTLELTDDTKTREEENKAIRLRTTCATTHTAAARAISENGIDTSYFVR